MITKSRLPRAFVAYWRAHVNARWWLTTRLSPEEYVLAWSGDVARFRTHSREELEDGTVWKWLLDRGYATPQDADGLRELLDRTQHNDFYVRPGLQISKTWTWQDATELDDGGRLIPVVAEAIDDLLAALGEPDLAALRPT